VGKAETILALLLILLIISFSGYLTPLWNTHRHISYNTTFISTSIRTTSNVMNSSSNPFSVTHMYTESTRTMQQYTKTSENNIYKNHLVLSGFSIWINSSYIKIWQKGIVDFPSIHVEGNGIDFWIDGYDSFNTSDIVAIPVIADRNGCTMYISLSSLWSKIEMPGTYDFYVFPSGFDIRIYFDTQKHVARIAGYTTFIPIGASGNSLYEVLLESLNSTTFNILRRAIWNDRIPSNEAGIVWSLVAYADSHFKYDYSKASLTYSSIYDPITFLKKGRGICIDYAVFYVSALLSAGFKNAYIVSMSTSKGGHALAVVEINNVYYALPQHLPVMELADYYQYYSMTLAARIYPNAYIYHVIMNNGEVKIILDKINLSKVRDAYPNDGIDAKFITLLTEDLAVLLHARISSYLPMGGYYYFNYKWGEFVCYSPVFAKYWAYWIAQDIATDIRKYTYSINYIVVERTGPLSFRVYYW